VIGGVISLSLVGGTFLLGDSVGDYGFFYVLFPLFLLTAYLPGQFLVFFGSAFHFDDPGLFAETHMAYAAVPFWIFIGSLIGCSIGYMKFKKEKR